MTPLIILGVVGALFILLLSLLTNNYSLNNIKSKTVGDGQYGTARWATDQEIRKAYVTVSFDVAAWRAGKKRPTVQGLVLGSVQRGKRLEALVDRDDVHCLMIGASGVGKTAFFLYPNIEYACACGMSFLILDTKGDLARNCGRIAQKYYGYRVSVVDLRNPIRSDGNNLMTLVNRYMDVAREHPDNLAARANAEKYAKILAKTIVNPGGDEQDRGQNSYFYDAAEGVLATVIMTLSEFIPPDSAGHDNREHAPKEVTALVQRWSSLGNQPFAERVEETDWEVALIIPYAVFFKHQIESLDGKEIKANFYKCGDELQTPHFLSWNPIEIDQPDFHRPDFFGTLEFE